ncbi:MAG: hypothetical protein WCS52_11800 [bacterium]
MALLASYSDPADAALALNALQRGQIPVERRVVEDQGLEFVEMHVADDGFDRACEVIEAHDAELMEARQKEAHQQSGCPSCGAPELKRRDDIDCSGSITGITYVMECQKCGKLFPR